MTQNRYKSTTTLNDFYKGINYIVSMSSNYEKVRNTFDEVSSLKKKLV